MAGLDALTAVYLAAMKPDPAQLPGRRSIMARHATFRGFRALAVTAGDADGTRDTGGTREGDRIRQAGGTRVEAPAVRSAAGHSDRGHQPGHDPAHRADEIIAFSYAFSGQNGQWWHDVVAAALIAKSGPKVATQWLADSLEIAEVHVHPDYHRRGIGRSLVLGLADGRQERTAVLSTQDAQSPARHLYRRLGFTDLLTGYAFPGTPVPYAVMGAELPLADRAAAEPGAPRSPSPSRP